MAFVSAVFICHRFFSFFLAACLRTIAIYFNGEWKWQRTIQMLFCHEILMNSEDVDDIWAALKWYVLNSSRWFVKRLISFETSHVMYYSVLKHCSRCSRCNEFSICQNQFGHKIRPFFSSGIFYANKILLSLPIRLLFSTVRRSDFENQQMLKITFLCVIFVPFQFIYMAILCHWRLRMVFGKGIKIKQALSWLLKKR